MSHTVGVGDGQVAGVLIAVAVGVADERDLVVVVEVGVGDGNVVRGVGDVAETVVVAVARVSIDRRNSSLSRDLLLAMVHVRAQVHVVNPNVLGFLDTNGITSVREDLADGEVADDDVLDVLDVEGDTLELGAGVDTEDGLVAGDASLAIAADGALDVDDGWAISFSGLGESREGGNGGGSAASAPSGAIARQ